MPRQPRTQNNRFVHPDTLVCQHAATTRTRTHARTHTQNLTDSSTSTRLRALQRTHEPLHRARAHVHSEKSSTHTARTPLLSKWVPGCCEHGGTPNQTGSGDAYRISSSCTITKLPCQPPLALHTFRSNLVSTGFTRTTVQRVRASALCAWATFLSGRARTRGAMVRVYVEARVDACCGARVSQILCACVRVCVCGSLLRVDRLTCPGERIG